jgi:L-alanine-DL-glutamate epimerase-like enolase superfamily enzyme
VSGVNSRTDGGRVRPDHGQRISVRLTVERLPLRRHFQITGRLFQDIPVLIVELRRGNCTGRGEASGVYYRGETPDVMAGQVRVVVDAIGRGASRQELLQLLPPGGARNALDCALWDLEAKEASMPVWHLAGMDRPQALLTTWTLGADEPDAMAGLAQEYRQARALKLKLLGDGQDAARVRAVRSVRPDVWLGVDANQGFSVRDLADLIPEFEKAAVQLIEQPLAVGQEAALRNFQSPIPIGADESIQSSADLALAVECFDVVNIKLDKCGGLTEALVMAHSCRELGIKVMVGNMMGSSYAMAPAFVVGQLCDVVDLDGPLLLSADRVPSVEYVDGYIYCDQEVWG